jgi:uncharacterized protein (DUF952 family)
VASSDPQHPTLRDLDLTPKRIYHIATSLAWAAAQQEDFYIHASLNTEGFIHCSFWDQVAETLALHFQGQADVVLLEIEPAALSAELKTEASRNGQLFPHLYGPLNLNAVVNITPLDPLTQQFAGQ